ncbi:hypothetical protein [Streptomyces tsukubensis]|uniref:Hydrogenase expression protein HypF n=1 Tax=Streptomyces tsukubensis TaxID=83656 RepID=A0A1V4A9M0_9ACTN|nr:hypothetical protein [Streptomyces tsukubensis]OON79729.1 hypothetical protein B1H18_13485 [Streptomyces tsukubensis]QFR95776.1 hypothetical protein GBW32_25510 [Streptomyces tsukubensis]
MRGDESRTTAAAEDRPRDRVGPRHAAPRKSLLTKLQIPAGKAMALAAMPTAVFVGMGLTPRLALADDKPDIPYAPGPCVTRSDSPSADPSDASPSPSGSPSPKAGDKPSASPSPSPSASSSSSTKKADGDKGKGEDAETKEPEKSGSAGKSASGKPDTATSTPAPTPSPSKSKNPLDPLGVGEALGELFNPKETKTDEPSPEPSTSSSTGTGKPAEDAEKPADDSDADKSDADKSGGSKSGDGKSDAGAAGDGKAAPGDKAGGSGNRLKKDIEEAAGKAGHSVEELSDAAKGKAGDAAKGEGTDGKEPFPCPTADPKALADADVEQGIPPLPDDPWQLDSSKLTLNGLDYKGVVKVRTAGGTVKNVLKFTASSLDIKDLDQTTVGPNGTTGHVQASPGSTSTFRDGEVTMYTEELKGNLFGLIPITFSPDTPPPINVPFAFFTDVHVVQAGQFGGDLTIPGLHNYYDGGK